MHTRIVCTLGPASESEDLVRALIEEGMSYARLNFSHGTHEEHRRRAVRVRRAAAAVGRPVELIQDLQGPKIRTVRTPHTVLVRGTDVVLSEAQLAGAIQIAPEGVLEGVLSGHLVYIDDGLIELEVLDHGPVRVRCRVLSGGEIEGNQGVVFPSSVLPLSALTEKDVADAAFGRELGVEWVALSFVQSWEDLEALRPHVAPDARVIAKVETRAALEDMKSIVAAADAVMVARGDLGVSIPRARVPLVQKDLILACREQGTSSIVATEMLLSMVHNPHPTRAEVADVATAVLDGGNAVMLSEETAIGAYPVQAVAQMREIIETVEASPYYQWHRTDV